MEINYTYPVILEDTEDNEIIDVIAIDFNGRRTCVEREHCIEQIQDFLSLEIDEYETSGQKLPKASNVDEIELKENQKLVFVDLWMPYHRSQIKIQYTKKTLTIPTWLDILAKEKNINFSSVLVKALKKELGLEKE